MFPFREIYDTIKKWIFEFHVFKPRKKINAVENATQTMYAASCDTEKKALFSQAFCLIRNWIIFVYNCDDLFVSIFSIQCYNMNMNLKF